MFHLNSQRIIFAHCGSVAEEALLNVSQMDVFAPRLRIAFKWMVRAFSGYLSTDQLLLLWDRILGYDSLEVVAGELLHSASILVQTLL